MDANRGMPAMSSNAKRRHVSIYLTQQTLKRIEQVRTQLLIDEDLRLSKSELIERAILLGLEVSKKLVQEGRTGS